MQAIQGDVHTLHNVSVPDTYSYSSLSQLVTQCVVLDDNFLLPSEHYTRHFLSVVEAIVN